MAKQILFGEEAIDKIKEGTIKTCKALKVTLGPRGRNVFIDRSWGEPTSTKDGAQVADEIELIDKNENLAAQLIKEAASKTHDKVGDGTTTTVVVAEALILGGLRAIAAGHAPINLQKGFNKILKEAVNQLEKMSKKIEGPLGENKYLLSVATVSANNDEVIGNNIVKALAKAGRDGVVTIEEGKSASTEIKIIEGMQFDRGFLSPYFINVEDEAKVVLENPYILIHEDKISTITKLIPLLERLAEVKKPLLIIAEDVEGDALAALVVNKLKGILECAAVKAPGYGDRRKAMLEDIAVLVGGQAIFKDLGIDLEKVDIFSYLGRAKKVIIDSENTIIEEGAGSTADINKRIAQIRKEIELSDSDYEKEKAQERLARLSGGIAQINVGAHTEPELKELKKRYEGALSAAKAALDAGVLPGGGVAYVRVASKLDPKNLNLEKDEMISLDIFKSALKAPFKQIMENSGLDSDVILRKVETSNGNYGYDVLTNCYGDMLELKVVDATKVMVTALQNAVSVANSLLTANVLISEIPEKEGKPYPPGAPCDYSPEDYD